MVISRNRCSNDANQDAMVPQLCWGDIFLFAWIIYEILDKLHRPANTVLILNFFPQHLSFLPNIWIIN